ncbi:MAG: ABC transporter ATP-binding protein [Oscillospiraceae bacterium]
MLKPNLKPVSQPQKLTSYLKREWRVLFLVTVSGILFDGSMSLIAIFQGRLIDSVVDRAPLDAVLKSAGVFLLVTFAILIMRVLKRYFVRLFANRTGLSMRRMLYNSIMGEEVSRLSSAEAGEIMNKAVGDVDICVEGIRKVTTEIFDTGVLMLGYFVSMLGFDVKTTLIACAFIPLAMFIAEKLKSRIERYTKSARAQSGKIASLTLNNVENALLYRVNSTEERKNENYETELAELRRRAIRANVLENSMQPIYNAIALLGIAGVIIFGGGKVLAGAWTIGDLTAYIGIFTALAIKASKAAKLFISYQKAAVSWQRIKPGFEEYHYPDEKDFSSDENPSLHCQGFGFSYEGGDSPIFENLDFDAKAGDIIGVTGAVASGKTALGLALTGLFPYSGSLQLNGRELSDFSPYQRSRRVSYMGHDPQLLMGTIYENISLGEGGDISEVLRQVCFDEDLKTLPRGINTLIGDRGAGLSGGQKARIALARALYRNAELIILDDPFSAVDMKTEQKIIDNLRANYGNSIIILISHRLTVFPQTEKVLFFENSGKLLPSTHNQLQSQNPEYQMLFQK